MKNPLPPAEFAVPPNRHTYEVLEPLLTHPELAGDTINDFFIGQVASSAVTLGRAALIQEDVPSYQQWAGHVEDFVDRLQFRPISLVPGQFYSHLAELQFYAAIHGDEQAAEKLHVLLTHDPDDYAINGVLDTCAKEGIAPQAWIDRFKPTPDKRAAAWHNYTFTRRRTAAERGEFVSHDELIGLGAGYVVEDYIAGKLSVETAFMVSTTVYDFAQSVEQKNNIIDRFGVTLHMEEIAESRYRNLFGFAARVNADPDIAPDKQEDLRQEIDGRIPPEAIGTKVSYSEFGAYAMSVEIAQGEARGDIVEAIAEIADTIDHAYRAAEFYDNTVLAVANMYSDRGEFTNAAAMIAKLDSTARWAAAAQKYSELGGELDDVLAQDEMRRITKYSGAGAFSPEYHRVQPEARRETVDFLQKMKDRDYAGAEAVVISMVQKLGSNHPEVLRDYQFPGFIRRLLAENPGSARIGMQVVSGIENATFGYHQQIYEAFIAAGNQEVEAFSWARIQQGLHGRVTYLSQYAGAVLAAAQSES